MMSNDKANKWMARLIADAQAHRARQEQLSGIAERSKKSVADYLAGKSKNIGAATVGLDLFAGIAGSSGCVRVLAGDPHGFGELDRACLYRCWSLRLQARNFDHFPVHDRQAIVMMENVATSWMHAESIGALSIRRPLDALVRSADAAGSAVIGRKMNALCTLAAHFVTGRSAADLQRDGWAPIGPYASVVDRTFTAQDYDALADYHQKETKGAGYPAFDGYPYCLLPVELQVIARRTGIPIAGTHPLITSPLSQLRDVPEIPMTDELAAIVARATRNFRSRCNPRSGAVGEVDRLAEPCASRARDFFPRTLRQIPGQRVFVRAAA